MTKIKIDSDTLFKIQEVVSKYDGSAKVEFSSYVGFDITNCTPGGIFDHRETTGAYISTELDTFSLSTVSSHWSYSEAIKIKEEVDNCIRFLGDIKKISSKLVKD